MRGRAHIHIERAQREEEDTHREHRGRKSTHIESTVGRAHTGRAQREEEHTQRAQREEHTQREHE